MIILNGFSACFKTSLVKYLSDTFNYVESDSTIFKELRDLNLMDWKVSPRLISKYITLRYFENTNTLVDRSLIDQLFFNELMYRDLLEYKAPDCIDVYKDTDKYLELEKQLNCKHVLIINNWKSSISNLINSEGFNESLRYDMYHNVDEYYMAQSDYCHFYFNRFGDPDLVITIDDSYDKYSDPYIEVLEFMKNKLKTIL